MSPTQRSLQKLRADGWTCAVTERWNPYAKIRQDLFGFIDVLAFKGDTVLAVQATSGSNVSARVEKIKGLQSASLWLESPNRKIEVWGWRKAGQKGRRKTWECRTISIDHSTHDFTGHHD